MRVELAARVRGVLGSEPGLQILLERFEGGAMLGVCNASHCEGANHGARVC